MTTEHRAPSVDDAIAAIRAFQRAKGLSIYELSKKARVPRSSLRFFHDEAWHPNAVTLRALHALIPPDFTPAKADEPETRALIRSLASLNELLSQIPTRDPQRREILNRRKAVKRALQSA